MKVKINNILLEENKIYRTLQINRKPKIILSEKELSKIIFLKEFWHQQELSLWLHQTHSSNNFHYHLISSLFRLP